ncbi:uncharacterized protein N7469_005378 [Penicillium citrinum]|uniref:Epidermal growth factor receptor-like transmembrane-juxtamembrane segment domain-containing protein n=2 Tax=Penicillium TaxID=5073 RepID=A0A9W9P1G8_PENCI|nr:uncharacterized protein N7469_005378 [Penicillium citrinum]KAJ5233612.1 hypothetical protein N7469_005378 [Penicillium citrinum]KAJ5572917.1 hypothetical protein N7450_009901 [Penicillium hetheringtonii]
MSERIGPGYAIRRKYSCNDGEESDDAWARYHYKVCCPGGHGLTFGKDNGDGNTFCENKKLSSDKIDNVCANGTWNLWFADAYFCCEPGLTGYISRTPDNNVKEAAFGCDTKSFIHSGLKGVISEAELSNPKSSNHGPNKGAIAGGVVGGVCGALIIAVIVWFLLRRRRRSKVTENLGDSPETNKDSFPGATEPPVEAEGDSKRANELYDYSPARTELEADKQARQELTGDTIRTTKQDQPSELP